MANPTVSTVPSRSFRGITPVLAAGRGVGDFGAVAAATAATMTINDPDVNPSMNVFAEVQAGPAAQFVIVSAAAGDKKVVLTVMNILAVAATAGNTTVAYYCTQG